MKQDFGRKIEIDKYWNHKVSLVLTFIWQLETIKGRPFSFPSVPNFIISIAFVSTEINLRLLQKDEGQKSQISY